MSRLSVPVTPSGSTKIYAHQQPVRYPRRPTILLFALFVVNTIFPFFDVPLLGLSISAVFLALVTLEVIFRLGYLDFRAQGRWLILGYMVVLGISVSVFANSVMGGLVIDASMLLALIQAAYWVMVFLFTMAFVSHLKPDDLRALVLLMGVSIIIVGLIRLYEGIAFDRWGPGTSRIFTQNAYGILFSIFTPYAVVSPFLVRSRRIRIALVAGVIALIAGITINGSRSSWVAAASGITMLTSMFAVAQRKRVFSLVGLAAVALIVSVLLLSVMPAAVLAPISERFATLEQYEEDKSYATRVLMQQKSQLIFEENPLFGVGRNQFRDAYVDLDFSGMPFTVDRLDQFNSISSHNSYAQLLGETGLSGVVPYGLLLITLVLAGFRSALMLGRRGEVWALAVFASLIAMSIHMWAIDNLKTTAPWFIYGMVAAMIQCSKSPPQSDSIQ